MAKKKTEKFMTPKKGHKFYKGVHCFKPGDKIPEGFFTDPKGKALDNFEFPGLEEWKEPSPEPVDNKKNDPPPFGPEQI